ncbi:DUF3572 family protein [Devosia albogilva]|uniref:DUF3572 family protein n=1 Tax=Devosia albogilva TaxID=429726 RepID=A0ABW5QFD6_9HYPH
MPRSDSANPRVSDLADSCLSFLAEHPEELMAFMQVAGLDPEALRRSVGTPDLQHGLIDYFAANEPILLALCANAGITPEQFMQVWHQQNRSEWS